MSEAHIGQWPRTTISNQPLGISQKSEPRIQLPSLIRAHSRNSRLDFYLRSSAQICGDFFSPAIYR
jgi:hypothetical protein